jgi:hypothetical protein
MATLRARKSNVKMGKSPKLPADVPYFPTLTELTAADQPREVGK